MYHTQLFPPNCLPYPMTTTAVCQPFQDAVVWWVHRSHAGMWRLGFDSKDKKTSSSTIHILYEVYNEIKTGTTLTWVSPSSLFSTVSRDLFWKVYETMRIFRSPFCFIQFYTLQTNRIMKPSPSASRSCHGIAVGQDGVGTGAYGEDHNTIKSRQIHRHISSILYVWGFSSNGPNETQKTIFNNLLVQFCSCKFGYSMFFPFRWPFS